MKNQLLIALVQSRQPGLHLMKTTVFATAALCAQVFTCAATLAADKPPIKALLLAGGCCHDYAGQKDILKNGLEARANVHVDVIFTEDSSTQTSENCTDHSTK